MDPDNWQNSAQCFETKRVPVVKDFVRFKKRHYDMLNEISQRLIPYDFTYMWHLKKITTLNL